MIFLFNLANRNISKGLLIQSMIQCSLITVVLILTDRWDANWEILVFSTLLSDNIFFRLLVTAPSRMTDIYHLLTECGVCSVSYQMKRAFSLDWSVFWPYFSRLSPSRLTLLASFRFVSFSRDLNSIEFQLFTSEFHDKRQRLFCSLFSALFRLSTRCYGCLRTVLYVYQAVGD